MIDFNDVSGLLNFYKDFVSSHDLESVDYSGYKQIHIGDEDDMASSKHLLELMAKDRYGEYLGRYYAQLKREKSLEKYNSVYAVFDGDDRLSAIQNWHSKMNYCSEIFEYYDDYYVGLKYVLVKLSPDSKLINTADLTFYISDGNRTSQMITVYDLSAIRKMRVDKTVLQYDNETASVKSSTASFYKQKANKYELEKQVDLLSPPPETSTKKPVYDNQKKLCRKLEKSVRQDMTLEQAVDAFFTVVAEAKPNDEEMLLYEVGCYPYGSTSKRCFFSLVRQTPARDGEYYQMHLQVIFEAGDDVEKLHECEWHEEGDDDLREVVLKSEAYGVLKGKDIAGIEVWADET